MHHSVKSPEIQNNTDGKRVSAQFLRGAAAGSMPESFKKCKRCTIDFKMCLSCLSKRVIFHYTTWHYSVKSPEIQNDTDGGPVSVQFLARDGWWRGARFGTFLPSGDAAGDSGGVIAGSMAAALSPDEPLCSQKPILWAYFLSDGALQNEMIHFTARKTKKN